MFWATLTCIVLALHGETEQRALSVRNANLIVDMIFRRFPLYSLPNDTYLCTVSLGRGLSYCS